MADHDETETTGGPTTALTRTAMAGDSAAPRVAHNMPFVAQLIANAYEPPVPPRRRRSDRSGPLRAYAALDAQPRGGTRRIV